MTSTIKNHFPWPSDSPLSRLILRRLTSDHPKCNLKDFIHSHHFNQHVDIILPTSLDKVKPTLDSFRNSKKSFFYHVTLNLECILDSSFLDSYIRSPDSNFYAMLHEASIDQHSTLCIYNGKLVLSLTGELYSQLGLQGSIESFGSIKNKKSVLQHKYRVVVDLTSVDFKPGNNKYDRVLWCFKDRIPPVSMLCCCYNKMDCSDIKFPDTVKDIKRYFIKDSCSSLESVLVPILDEENNTFHSDGPINVDEKHSKEDGIMQEFLMWSGMTSCKLSSVIQPSEDSIDGVLSHFRSGLKLKREEITIIQLEGFISPHIIQEYTNLLKILIDENNIPWGSITVNGFLDSPVSFGDCLHSNLFLHGENDYTLTLFPKNIYWQFVCLGSKDQYS